MNKILLVDDDENVLNAYRRNLRNKFDLTFAVGPAEALKQVKENGPFAVVISDYQMPVMNGIEMLSKIKGFNPDSIRIIITGYADLQTAMDAVNEGNIFRFLTKPCAKEVLINTISEAIKQFELISTERELLDKTLKGTIKVLIDILSIVNPSAFSKAARIRHLSRRIGLRLGLTDFWIIEISSLLSQIGCIAVPGQIIEKINQGETLSSNEKEIYYSHTNIGLELLDKIPRLDEIKKALKYQNTRFDGIGKNGNEISGMAIPIIARILKVVNDYDIYTRYSADSQKVIDMMQKDEGAYDKNILLSLEAEVKGINKDFVLKSISLNEISEGMMVAENINDENGTLLISRDTEISSAMIFRLKNYSKLNKIAEPIKVLVDK